MGFTKPTTIQTEAIPLALQGRDIIGLAQTGSGKTAAFSLPILQSLWEDPKPMFACVLAPTRCVLIAVASLRALAPRLLRSMLTCATLTVPLRRLLSELAYQIAQQIDGLGATIGVRTAVVVGGMDMMTQSIALSKRPHIVVATPGRLQDHLENTKGFSLKGIKYLVRPPPVWPPLVDDHADGHLFRSCRRFSTRRTVCSTSTLGRSSTRFSRSCRRSAIRTSFRRP